MLNNISSEGPSNQHLTFTQVQPEKGIGGQG